MGTSKFRLIDRVIIKGSTEPMELFSVDLDYKSVQVDDSPPLKVVWCARNRFRARQILHVRKAQLWSDQNEIVRTFDNDPNVSVMRRPYTAHFLQLFNMGYQNYAEGEWSVARR